jgi:excisionase family DNA binding protein
VPVLDGLVSDGRVRDGLKRAWAAHLATDADDTPNQAHRLESQVQRARENLQRPTTLLVDRMIEKGACADLAIKARADADAAEAELATVRYDAARPRPKLPPLDRLLATAGGWTTVLEGAAVVAQREVLAVLIERMVPVRERQSVYRVEITWTPLCDALRTTTRAKGSRLPGSRKSVRLLGPTELVNCKRAGWSDPISLRLLASLSAPVCQRLDARVCCYPRMSEGRLLTVSEVADRPRLKPETVRRWLRSGKLRGVSAGWRVPESNVKRLLPGSSQEAEEALDDRQR